jgi:hypothetical protein
MPLTPALFYADLVAARTAAPFPMAGVQFDRMALGIATAVHLWAAGQPQNVLLQGAAAGATGGGVVPTGKLVIPPNPAVMIASLNAAGMVGPLAISLGTIVGIAVPKTFSTSGMYVGVSPGVGVGADVAKVVLSNAPSLVALLISNLAAFSGRGPALAQMANGLGNGIARCVLLGFGFGNVVGVPGPSPAGTTTTSVVV